MESLLPLFGVAIVLVILGCVVRIVKPGRNKKEESYPYRKVQALFTPAERAFLVVLEQAVEGRSRVFGKVRLADVIEVESGLSQSGRQGALNRIQSKHIDFVVCDPNDFSVQLAIELDDSSHRRADRRRRDDFVDKAFAAADVRLFRLPVKRTFSVEDIREAIA